MNTIIVILFCVLIFLVICDYIFNYQKIKKLEESIKGINICCLGFQKIAREALIKCDTLLKENDNLKKEVEK